MSMRIDYETYQHPTEGLLVRATWFIDGGIGHVQNWRRSEDLRGKPVEPKYALAFCPDTTGVSMRDRGATAEMPELRVGVTGGPTPYDAIEGSIHSEGIDVEWGGACPVQGDGSATAIDRTEDGIPVTHQFYYRARGASWSVEFAGGFVYEESPYIWPDGGWLGAEENERNIRLAVAKWREHLRAKGP